MVKINSKKYYLMGKLGYNKKAGLYFRNGETSFISRRNFGLTLVGAALVVPWIFRHWSIAWIQSIDDDLFIINGWIVKRSQIPVEALQRATTIDL